MKSHLFAEDLSDPGMATKDERGNIKTLLPLITESWIDAA